MNVILIADVSEGHYYQQNVINQFIKTLKDEHKKTGEPVRLSLITFNDTITYNFLNRYINEVDDEIVLDIQGKSALLDKISAILVKLLHFYEKTKEQNPNVYIFTNGVDNASRNITPPLLKLQIERNRLRGWKFIYFGSGEKQN